MDKNAKKVGYFEHQPSGCFWYRTKHPMDALSRHGIKADIVKIDQDVDFYNIMSFQLYGIYPFSFNKVLNFLKEEGKKIIYDTDDALDLIQVTNPFYFSVKKDANSAREILQYVDHITVSTKPMLEYIRQKTDKPITILPNCFDSSEWNFNRPEKNEIRIGFAGSTTHVEDLIDIIPIIEKLQAKYHIKFYIMGFGKSNYEQWINSFRFASTQEGLIHLEKLTENLKKIKFEWVEFVNYDKYPELLVNMALDIGICPLKDNPFNNCRSASKAMEYTLSGALALASDTIPYRAEPTSILVKDNEWEEKLEYYITHSEERAKKYREHLNWIKENRDIDSPAIISLLKSIYEV